MDSQTLLQSLTIQPIVKYWNPIYIPRYYQRIPSTACEMGSHWVQMALRCTLGSECRESRGRMDRPSEFTILLIFSLSLETKQTKSVFYSHMPKIYIHSLKSFSEVCSHWKIYKIKAAQGEYIFRKHNIYIRFVLKSEYSGIQQISSTCCK